MWTGAFEAGFIGEQKIRKIKSSYVKKQLWLSVDARLK